MGPSRIADEVKHEPTFMFKRGGIIVFRELRRDMRILRLAALGFIGSFGCQAFESEVEAAPVRSMAAMAATEVDEETTEIADRYVGTWTFVGGKAEIDGRDQAVEDTVAELNSLIRGIARDKLTKASPIFQTIEVSRDGGALSIKFDDKEVVAGLDGGRTQTTGSDGGTLNYHLEIDDKHLYQVFKGDKGGKKNTFTLVGDKKVRVKFKITSKRLPKPVVYKLTFKKKG